MRLRRCRSLFQLIGERNQQAGPIDVQHFAGVCAVRRGQPADDFAAGQPRLHELQPSIEQFQHCRATPRGRVRFAQRRAGLKHESACSVGAGDSDERLKLLGIDGGRRRGGVRQRVRLQANGVAELRVEAGPQRRAGANQAWPPFEPMFEFGFRQAADSRVARDQDIGGFARGAPIRIGRQ